MKYSFYIRFHLKRDHKPLSCLETAETELLETTELGGSLYNDLRDHSRNIII